MSAAHQQSQQPERFTVASLAPPQRTQAEAECRRRSSQAMAGGAAAAFGAAFVAHQLLEANAPAYATMSRNAKFAIAVGLMGAGAYLTGRYMENKCRRERGLPVI